MRFAFIAKHRQIWPVSWLCAVLGASRSAFHAWLTRPTSAREIYDAKLVSAIETSFQASDRTYDARRVWRDVLEGACLRAAPDRTTDADQCPEGATQAPRQAEARRRTVEHRRQHPRPGLPGRPAEPEVAGRLHLYLDRRRLALRRGRAGPVFRPCRRQVNEGRSGCVTGHGCADDGRLATWKGRCSASSFGSGIAIHKRPISTPAG